MPQRPISACASYRLPRIAQFRNSEQVVRRTGNESRHLCFRLTDESGLSQTTHRFEPTEDLFDPFSFPLADSVAFGACRSPIESGCVPPVDARDVWPNTVFAQVRDELLHVVALVHRQRLGVDAAPAGAGEHRARSAVLGLCRFGHQNVHAQTVAVLHEHMAAVAQLGRLAVALPHEARVRIGRALMGRIRALLALEVDHAGTVASVLGRLTVLALEALERGPGIDQRAVDGEMIGREQTLATGKAHHLVEETARHIRGNQPFAQAAEIRLIEAGALQPHVEKPAKENVVVELLAELPVGSNRVQRDEQLALEQTLGRNRRAADVRIQRIEFRRDGAERSVGQLLDAPKRMIGRHARLGREVMKHRGLGVELATHRCQGKSLGSASMTNNRQVRSLGFASTC